MLGRARLAMSLLLTTIACGSDPAPRPQPPGTGGAPARPGAGGAAPTPATGGSAMGTGGSVGPPVPDASAPDVDEPAPALDTAPVPEVAADLAPEAPAALGPFPLEAIRAAKAELYVAADAHLEGPIYRKGEVFFAADGAGWGLMRIDAARKLYRYHPTLRPVGAYLLADDSMLYGDHEHVLTQVFPDGKVATLTAELNGRALPFVNDLTLDAEGNLYVSSRRSGELHRITPAGVTTRIASGLDVPNGVEVDPSNKWLYVALGSSIVRYPLAADGTLGRQEMVAPSGQPDGMAFDAWGNLWVAPWRTGRVVVHAADGKVITMVESGGPPINLTFGGPDNDTVFIATDYKGIYKFGPIKGLRGFSNPGAKQYQIKRMLDVMPANQPR